MTMRAPRTRCGFKLFQDCVSLSKRGVHHIKCGLDDFQPPATIQELGAGCGELLKMGFLRGYRWLEGNVVEIDIREGIHEPFD